MKIAKCMNRFILITFLLLTVLISCTPEGEDNQPGGKVDSYKISYMHYDFGFFSDDIVQIQYSNGKIVRRIGVTVLYFTGGFLLDPAAFETVTYNQNLAIVVKGTYGPG